MNNQPIKEHEVLNVTDFARRAGVCKMTIYRLVARRAVPHYRVGRALRFEMPGALDALRGDVERMQKVA